MGIFGLLTYMRNNCEGGFEFVKLSEIATQYKNETKKEPIILVDISSCIDCFVSKLEMKEPKTLKENVELFIHNCYDLGIKLKIVGDGMKPFSKYEVWKTSELAFIKHDNPCEFEVYRRFYLGVWFNVTTLIFQSSDKCEYVRALYEADDYIISYARTQGCFAILSNDSDFLIVDGARYFLSIKDLDIHSMTTYNFNRNNFAKSLNLSTSRLPIFGALVPTYVEVKFWQGDCKKKKDVVKNFEAVAELVRKLPENDLLDFNALELEPKEMLKFQERLQFFMLERVELQEITGDGNWTEIIRLAEKRHFAGIAEKIILQILKHRVNFLTCRSRNSYALDSCFSSLRKTIYGILFLEYPQKAIRVREYRVKGFQIEVKEVQFGPCSHCGLLKLWSEDRSPEVVIARRRVFCQALHKNLTPKMLQILDIKEEFLFSVLALFYLLSDNSRKISDSEARMFLLQTVLVNKLTAKEIQFHRKPPQLNSLCLGERFIMTVQHLQILNSVCGDPYCRSKTNFINIFDGTLYEYLQNRTENASWRAKDSVEPPEVMHELEVLNNKLNTLVYNCRKWR